MAQNGLHLLKISPKIGYPEKAFVALPLAGFGGCPVSQRVWPGDVGVSGGRGRLHGHQLIFPFVEKMNAEQRFLY